MAAQLAKAEFTRWITHLDNQPNNNIGVRNPSQWNANMIHLNAMRKVSSTQIQGHISGFGFEIEYSIHDMGTHALFVVSRTTSPNTVLADLTAEIARVSQKIAQEVVNQPIQRAKKAAKQKGWNSPKKKGEYYIQRNHRPNRTKTLNEAVNDGTVSISFADTCEKWHLTLIKGRN